MKRKQWSGILEVTRGYAAFREATFSLLAHDTPPATVHLTESDLEQVDLHMEPVPERPGTTLPRGVGPITVPQEFIRRARRVVCHRDPDRLDLLYRILWRLTHGERKFLENAEHPDVRRFAFMDTAVLKDQHDFNRRLQFGRHRVATGSLLLGYHRPVHFTLRLVAPELAQRYPNHRWVVFTSSESAFWDGEVIRFGPGATDAVAKQPRLLLQAVDAAFGPDRP